MFDDIHGNEKHKLLSQYHNLLFIIAFKVFQVKRHEKSRGVSFY